jgi:hypothetical protein
MGDRIMWARHEDTERIWLHENAEYSYRLITEKKQGSSFSFHLTTYLPFLDTVVEGDGEHETVLFCLHGWARHFDLSDDREWEFRPGHAMYLPKLYRYRRIVGSAGMTVAVACTPSRP